MLSLPELSGCEMDEEALLLALGHAKRPGPRPVGVEAVDLAIYTALKGASQLRVRYRGWRDEEARTRKVSPNGLLLGTRRYLVVVPEAKPENGTRHYRVDGIEDAVVLE
jgi:predicted DNA-binding transcriptional regulator YafY